MIDIIIGYNVIKMPSNNKMTFRVRRKIKEDMVLDRIEKKKGKWIL